MQDIGLSMNHNELPFVREMFDGIAPRYDFLNRLLSLRRDVFWRRSTVAALHLKPGDKVLDVACGTADVALEIMRQRGATVSVTGADFSIGMLRPAAAKIRRDGLGAAIQLTAADAFALPFRSQTFDAVSMAFGIRNIQNKVAVLKCFYDRLKRGGRMAVLELAPPAPGVMRKAYLFYFNRLLPFVGRFFSKHRFAYSYLPASVAAFPEADAFAALMRRAGFQHVCYRKMTLGIAVLFIGYKAV
jgi:demethylmenaquinone methyltransferase / 2-methoxy-6-polyprenyl-1,4-benzoquinol methylase